MDIQQIKDKVQDIRDHANDPEDAHTMEDDLHYRVLKYIATGKCTDPAYYAREAVKTEGIDFPRWCA